LRVVADHFRAYRQVRAQVRDTNGAVPVHVVGRGIKTLIRHIYSDSKWPVCTPQGYHTHAHTHNAGYGSDGRKAGRGHACSRNENETAFGTRRYYAHERAYWTTGLYPENYADRPDDRQTQRERERKRSY